MYKSKLQELCQQRKWQIPEYKNVKQGLDHNPRFQSTVVINDISFCSPSLSRSSKEAQNDAAKVAYDHFMLPPAPVPAPAPVPSPFIQFVPATEVAKPSSTSSIPSLGPLAANVGVNTHLTTRGTLQTSVEESNQNSSRSGTMVLDKNDGIRGPSATNVGMDSHLTTKGLQTKVEESNQNSLGSETVVLAENNGMRVSAGPASANYEVSSGGRTTQLDAQGSMQSPQGNQATLPARFNEILKDSPQLFKTQLQTYCQKRNLALPLYSCERKGPPHALRFKCKVIVGGQCYVCEELFPTLSRAEHAAAKVALSLLPGVEEDESAYKNLLQELAQKRGHLFPTYSTTKSGEAHVPIFTSIVEIGGKSFRGQEARTKKQAELSAAKIAYMSLKQDYSNTIVGEVSQKRKEDMEELYSSTAWVERLDEAKKQRLSQLLDPRSFDEGNSSQSSMGLSPTPAEQETPHYSSPSSRLGLTAYLQKNVQPKLSVPDEQACAEGSNPHLPISSLGPEGTSAIKRLPNDCAIALPPAIDPSSSLPADSSSTAIGPAIDHLVGKCSMCQNRIVIHPSETKVAYPAGCEVLPISNEDWVAVNVMPQPDQQSMEA